MNPSPCPFCRILKEKKESILWEDTKVFVILSHNPIHEGHALVISKKHVDSYLSLSDNLALHMQTVAKRIAPAVMKAVRTNSVIIAVNVGEASERSVPHCHVHIIPRSKGDGLSGWKGMKKSEKELSMIRKKIVSLLPKN